MTTHIVIRYGDEQLRYLSPSVPRVGDRIDYSERQGECKRKHWPTLVVNTVLWKVDPMPTDGGVLPYVELHCSRCNR